MLILQSLQQAILAGPDVPLCVAVPIAIAVYILYSRTGLRGWNGRD